MTELKRQNAILELLHRQGSLTINEIVNGFSVSPATARRDITKLDTQGKLKKVRNGAYAAEESNKSTTWSPMNIHQTSNYDEKSKIAKKAAELCKNGESIVINCGSTAFLLGQEINGKPVQVITNYFPLLNYLIEQNHDNLVVLGGQFYKEKNLFLSTDQTSDAFYAGHYMFTSGSGLSEEGLFKVDLLSAMVEQKMVKHVNKLVALVDSSKVGGRIGTIFATAEQLDIVITGKDANPKVVAALKEKGVDVILV
ncbi:HTH-type transcriptional regulator UlaR [Pasteurellaceae bacterium USgator11]|nr:HTH-type transcriptional regulator UlaR [Pasteurellaceae bacterium USgator41]TNG96975.1 HTH-type transcriptional regulator UlaR [Pasteurellaceae bacterium UScroc31]TNG97155.1 HTH-type transcriptional regulator UlaR [Pasteurellaceae bacterium UScroc12]TNH03132.1 HTH-type transcriptional regulator UlaR [Pasteurellaceae bacterium USgator11]